jgi:hypothetical protein
MKNKHRHPEPEQKLRAANQADARLGHDTRKSTPGRELNTGRLNWAGAQLAREEQKPAKKKLDGDSQHRDPRPTENGS